jgi:hypothetical protein
MEHTAQQRPDHRFQPIPLVAQIPCALSLRPIRKQDEWDIWKKWYEKQKTQYLREDIPIETFYGQMRQLNEFVMIH